MLLFLEIMISLLEDRDRLLAKLFEDRDRVLSKLAASTEKLGSRLSRSSSRSRTSRSRTSRSRTSTTDIEPLIPMTIPMPVPSERQMNQYSGRYRSTGDGMIYAELRTEEFPQYKYDLFNPPPAYTNRSGTWKLTDEKPQRWKFDEDIEPSIPMTIPMIIPMPALVPTIAMPSKR